MSRPIGETAEVLSDPPEWAWLEVRLEDLASENEVLRLITRILGDLTQMLLEGEELSSLVDVLARLLGNPLSVSDRFRHIVAHSPVGSSADPVWREGMTRLRTPQGILQDPVISELFERLRREKRPVLLPLRPLRGMAQRRLATPILANGHVLGFLGMLEAQQPFMDFHPLVLRHAAVILALALTRQQVALDTERRLTSDFLADLFSGDYASPATIVTRAGSLGIDLHRTWSMLLLDVDEIEVLRVALQVEDEIAARAGLLEMVRSVACSQSPGSVVVVQGGSIVVLSRVLSGEADLAEMDSKALAEVLKNYVRKACSGIDVLIAVGGLCTSLEDFAKRYEQAKTALDIGRSFHVRDRTVTLDDLGVYSVLFRRDDPDELRRFAGDLLSPLMENDEKHGTKLLETLEVYLNENGALRKTARRLFVHVSTLRGRLDRVEHLCDLDLRNAKARLNLQISMEVYRMAKGIGGSLSNVPGQPRHH